MPESAEDRIARLLNEGLEHYGVGEVAEAILAWEEVLLLDPANSDARDYLKTADRRKHPREPAQGEASPAVKALVGEARGLIQQGELEAALDLLRSAADAHAAPTPLEIHASIELVRARLLVCYRERIGDLAAVPVLKANGEALTKFNLPADAGFVLSMVDGATALSDLISLSGMDSFEVLRVFQGLQQAGLMEIEG